MIKDKYSILLEKLYLRIPKDQVFTDELNRLAYGTDASFYRLIPQIVVKVKNHQQAQFVISECNLNSIPLTFRAAGTSLSGQAISDSVLMVIDRDWSGHTISPDHNLISLDPAVVGAFANSYLKPYSKKIGPDPASINSAMIGGIAANNASGMCCGTAQNSYNTLANMKIIFVDGTVLDTGDKQSVEGFKKEKSTLIEKIVELRNKTVADTELTSLIRNKYKMKNTTGYNINSIIDFDGPIDIIQHLMIGSEGTLGFISEITYKTITENKFKASALILFKNLEDACNAVFELKNQTVDAVELMDRASLRSVEDKPGMPGYLKSLDKNACSLLVETSANETTVLNKQIDEINNCLQSFTLLRPIEFTDIPAEYAKLWKIRKGLFPSVGAMRESGTTVIIEDVAYPLDKLADAGLALQALFEKYGYSEAIIFGHALEGNFHFVFNQDFNDPKEVDRYKSFMDEVVEMTAVRFGGSLKAEHGTGRNMAPFVKDEWGEKAYSIMQEIKKIFDPENLLNPGVILNNDSNAHIKNLKPLPKANEIIDKCIECGFCEVNCPSKDLTLTPRQRIAVYREISRLEIENNDPSKLIELKTGFQYSGEETCAVDGLCELSCPVSINTGNLVKQLRFESNSSTQQRIASILARNLSVLTTLGRTGLLFVKLFHRVLGTENFLKIAAFKRKLIGRNFPAVNKWIPGHADKIIKSSKNKFDKSVVYFPSCISRTMGLPLGSDEKAGQTTVMIELLEKAGYNIIYPKTLKNLCCGMPWSSKGFKQQGAEKSDELLLELEASSKFGELPILFDTSPCVYHLREYIQGKSPDSKLNIYEPVEFINDFLLDELEISKSDEKIAIHTTCSSTKMGLADKFINVANACSTNVVVPEKVSCCGFAGDRGFSFPELNQSALSSLKEQVKDCSCGYSNSKTCEIGLSEESGIEYKSIVYLINKVSKKKL